MQKLMNLKNIKIERWGSITALTLSFLFIGIIAFFWNDFFKIGYVPKARGDWFKYTTFVKELAQQTHSTIYATYLNRGYSIYLIFINSLIGVPENLTNDPLHSLAPVAFTASHYLWGSALLFIWLALFIKHRLLLANLSFALLILILYLDRFNYTVTFLSETIYAPLLLFIFGFLMLWDQLHKNIFLLCASIFIVLSNEIRPFTIVGLGIPIFLHLIYQIKQKKMNKIVLLYFIVGILLAKLPIIYYMHPYEQVTPKTSIPYLTFRIIHLDGHVLEKNGPYSQYLVKTNRKFIGPEERLGIIEANIETFEALYKEQGYEGVKKVYLMAAWESFKHSPWIFFRNSVVNVISHFVSYDLGFLYERKKSITNNLFIDTPTQWEKPLELIWPAVLNLIQRPFYFMALIIFLIWGVRKELNLINSLAMILMGMNMMAATFFQWYLYRYAWPGIIIFIVTLFPFLMEKLKESIARKIPTIYDGHEQQTLETHLHPTS